MSKIHGVTGVRRSQLVRASFLGIAGVLALASYAWACVAHSMPGGAELAIYVAGTPAEGHVALKTGVDYTWDATGLTSGTNYSIRYSPMTNATSLTSTCSNASSPTETVVTGNASASGQLTDTKTLPSSTPSNKYEACVVKTSDSSYAERYAIVII